MDQLISIAIPTSFASKAINSTGKRMALQIPLAPAQFSGLGIPKPAPCAHQTIVGATKPELLRSPPELSEPVPRTDPAGPILKFPFEDVQLRELIFN